MNKVVFCHLYREVLARGYSEEICWAESLKPCDNAEEFCWQAIWVILSSGMKNQVARSIERRIIDAHRRGHSVGEVFGHGGKVKAIEWFLANKERAFQGWSACNNDDEKLAYLDSLPFIGSITKFHLAKNLGMDVAKPDRHLERIAKAYDTTPAELCGRLAKEMDLRVATVDLIIWRAANLGLI